MEIKTALLQVKERIQEAAARARRNPAEVGIVLVTKTVPPERIREAFRAGHRDFGENRLQELQAKKPELPGEIRWHFVGHLQTNKVKPLLNLFDPLTHPSPPEGERVEGRESKRFPPLPLGEGGGEGENRHRFKNRSTILPILLHSLDRIPLAEELQKEAEKRAARIDALIQVNTSREATKSGFSPEETEEMAEKIRGFSNLRVRGLMTIGPLTEEEGKIRTSFQTLRKLRDALQPKLGAEPLHLSMGMSSDFEMAVEEGATLVRIGSAVFGERKLT